MKIILCIAGQKIAPHILSKLSEEQFRVTTLASEGGFLKRGNVTYLIGVEDDQVQHVLELIRGLRAKYEESTPSRHALAIVLDAAAGAALEKTSVDK